MPKPSLYITDERMLLLMEWAVKKQIDGIQFETEYWERIGFQRTAIGNVKKGIQGFTKEQIRKACELTGASADYIFGFQNTMMRKPAKKGIELLKEAVLSVELELKGK